MQHICVFSRIQGQEMGNEFNYDKVYTASLNANEKFKKFDEMIK